jgi:hypothetical protein
MDGEQPCTAHCLLMEFSGCTPPPSPHPLSALLLPPYHPFSPQGETPVVAEAIFEAALPRQAGDRLPSSPAGVVVAVADRLDSLVGLFAAGCAPTASADQYGIRRAAYGMLQVRGAGLLRGPAKHYRPNMTCV